MLQKLKSLNISKLIPEELDLFGVLAKYQQSGSITQVPDLLWDIAISQEADFAITEKAIQRFSDSLRGVNYKYGRKYIYSIIDILKEENHPASLNVIKLFMGAIK